MILFTVFIEASVASMSVLIKKKESINRTITVLAAIAYEYIFCLLNMKNIKESPPKTS